MNNDTMLFYEKDHKKVNDLGTYGASFIQTQIDGLKSSIDFHFKEIAYHGDNGMHTEQIILSTKKLVEWSGAHFIAKEREEKIQKEWDDQFSQL